MEVGSSVIVEDKDGDWEGFVAATEWYNGDRYFIVIGDCK